MRITLRRLEIAAVLHSPPGKQIAFVRKTWTMAEAYVFIRAANKQGRSDFYVAANRGESVNVMAFEEGWALIENGEGIKGYFPPTYLMR